MRFVRGKRGMAAAGEDSIIQKLQSAAADGMPAGDGLSAERVQTVMRFTQRVIKDYERKHGTDNFLSDDFKACDMKCVEFEMVRFSSEVLGVVTGTPIDDDGAEEPAEDLKGLVARKNFLRMQNWEDNRSVLAEKLRPIDQKLLALDPKKTMDQENIRFLNDQRDFYMEQYRSFSKRCENETARIDQKLRHVNSADLPDSETVGMIDLDGNKLNKEALEETDGTFHVKLNLKDPMAGRDIRGISSGVANLDGTPVSPPAKPKLGTPNAPPSAKRNDDGTYPKPRGRAPQNAQKQPAEWCPITGEWLDEGQPLAPKKPKKPAAKKRKVSPRK